MLTAPMATNTTTDANHKRSISQCFLDFALNSVQGAIALIALDRSVRACLKIEWGPAARDFGGGQGGEVGASPQRAVTAEPTQATGKRSAAGPHPIFKQALRVTAGLSTTQGRPRGPPNC